MSPYVHNLFWHRDDKRNMHRFYALTIAKDLFGVIILTRNWGRIGGYGQSLEETYPDHQSASRRFEALCQIRQRRGYESVPLLADPIRTL